MPLLNYLEYDRDRSKAILSKELGWRDYGGKHYDRSGHVFFKDIIFLRNLATTSVARICPLICSDQIERQAALDELELPPYDESLLNQDLEFVIKKFELDQEKFDALMNAPMREDGNMPLFPSDETLQEYLQENRHISLMEFDGGTVSIPTNAFALFISTHLLSPTKTSSKRLKVL